MDQIRRLREKGDAGRVIQYAVHRWRRGDFVIGKKPRRKKGGDLLQVFPLWRKPDGVEDWQLREILDQHWKVPDEALHAKLKEEIAMLDKEIAEMYKLLPTFIIEGEGEL